MSGHGKEVCPAGVMVRQCRCIEGHRNVRTVACPPEHDHSSIPHLETDEIEEAHRGEHGPESVG